MGARGGGEVSIYFDVVLFVFTNKHRGKRGLKNTERNLNGGLCSDIGEILKLRNYACSHSDVSFAHYSSSGCALALWALSS